MRYNTHGLSVDIIDGLDLSISQGEVIGVFGSNGCGKSTLLRLLGGLAPMSGGEMTWHVTSPRVSLIPQDFRSALLPWYSARENLELPYRFRNTGNGNAESAISSLIGSLGENFDLSKSPEELSGGQQQILTIMCALMQVPKLLLMDEPFSALNLQRLFDFRPALRRWWRQHQITVVIVSHSLDDLLMVADRLLVVNGPPLRVIGEEIIPELGERSEASVLSVPMIEIKTRVFRAIRGAEVGSKGFATP